MTTPLFHAFDRSTYMRLVPRHLGDVLSMDDSMISHLAAGGLVASISGMAHLTEVLVLMKIMK